MKKLGLIWLLTGFALAFQPPKVNMTGVILDLQGQPVDDASITIVHKEGEKFEKTLESKGSGKFNLLNVPAGLLDITVSKQGYQTNTYEFDLRPERKRAVLRLIPDAQTVADLGPQTKISGQVVDSQGLGIPNVSLNISSKNLPGFEKEITTNESGEFETEALDWAVVKIHARRTDYRDSIYLYYHTDSDTRLPVGDLKMQTLEEAYAELGDDAPRREMKPEAQAIELYNLAVGPYQEGNFDQATEYALKALELDPKQTAAMQMLVYIHAKQGDLVSAKKYADTFLAEKPGDPGMTKYAEQIEKGLKNPAGAVTSSDGDSAQSYFNKAIDAINANDDGTATNLLKKAIEKDEAFALAHFELGKIFVREFEFEKAIAELKLYLKYAPKDHKLRKEATDLIVTLSE